MRVVKLISGGQTGADRGGLRAAARLGLERGGCVPKGRRAEDGCVPTEFKEMTELESPLYAARAEHNVLSSAATVVFTRGELRGGSAQVFEMARVYERPARWLNLGDGQPLAAHAVELRAWLDALPMGSGAVNVAGQRESRSPGIETEVENALVFALSEEPDVALVRRSLEAALTPVAPSAPTGHDA